MFLRSELLAVRAEPEEHLGLVVAGLFACEGRGQDAAGGVEPGDPAGHEAVGGDPAEACLKSFRQERVRCGRL